MFRPLAIFTASACLMACAGAHGSHRTPFTCSVPEKPRVWPVIRASSVPPGRFDLKVLDPPAPSGRQLDRRIQISADAIPIGTFASRLAEALGTGIAVSHEVIDTRVSITAQSITLLSLLENLGVSHVESVGGDPILLVTEFEAWERRQSRFDHAGFSMNLIKLRRPERAEQLAAMGCAQIIGEGGSVAVVGDTLIVRGQGEALSRFRSAVGALDEPEPESR